MRRNSKNRERKDDKLKLLELLPFPGSTVIVILLEPLRRQVLHSNNRLADVKGFALSQYRMIDEIYYHTHDGCF